MARSEVRTTVKKEIDDSFPDGQYYVVDDFNSSEIQFEGDAYNPIRTAIVPASKAFKKGELVNVVTFTKDTAMNTVKAIQKDSRTFNADQSKLSKVKPIESISGNLTNEEEKLYGNKIKLMLLGAFILGFLLAKIKK
jgi:hypothetical protein